MNDNLMMLSRILGWCTVFGFLVLFIWFALFMMPQTPICSIHGSMFGISDHECALLNYGGMGLLKLAVIVFFFFPWLAIRMGSRKSK